MGYDISRSAVPLVDPDRCSGCGLCAEHCPSDTLVLREGRIHVEPGNFLGCIGCGQCMMLCPTEGITVSGRRLDASDLAGLPPPAEWATAAQLDGLLLARRSVRQYTDEEVDRALVDRILEMTATAPTGIPPNDVGVVVFHGRAKVRAFTAEVVESFRRVERLLHPPMLWLLRMMMPAAEYRGMREFVRPLLQHIVRCHEAGRDVFAYDPPLFLLFHYAPTAGPAEVHIAATYAMLAAQSLGLASCMLGTTAALDRDRALKARYGIPARNKMGLGLSVGHPAATYRRSLRRKLGWVRFA